jgi:Tfp pilus assembly protein PilX
MNNKKQIIKNERGMVLLTVLMVSLIITFIGLSFADLAIGQYNRTTKNVFSANALQVSEAGAEESLHKINQTSTFTGFAETVFFNNATQGRGTYTSTITAGSGQNEKIITSTGKVYRYNQTTNPVSTRVIKLTVVGTSSPGYSVQAGPGGLILGGSASVTNSSVYVNGTITLSGAASIGTNSQPLEVNVAYQACPTGTNPGATFAVVCTTGQPITLAQSTFIYGTVCATRQTSVGPNNNIKTGTTGQGLKPNCTAPPITAPTYDLYHCWQ